MTTTKLDPFTLEIVKDSLLSAGDEMFVALAYFYESNYL